MLDSARYSAELMQEKKTRKAFNRSQKQSIFFGIIAAIILGATGHVNAFALGENLLAISIVLLGFILTAVSVLIASIRKLKKDIYLRQLLSHPNIYYSLAANVRWLIYGLFANIVIGILIITVENSGNFLIYILEPFSPERTVIEAIETNESILYLLNIIVLSELTFCGFLLWFVARRLTEIGLEVGRLSLTDKK